MKKMYAVLTMVIVGVLLTGCLSKSTIKQGEADVKKPINPATAVEDIKTLEAEKARVGQEVLAGVTSVVPVGAALNILQLQERSELKVAIGEYNRIGEF